MDDPPFDVNRALWIAVASKVQPSVSQQILVHFTTDSTADERAEAAFISRLLEEPRDRHARLVFADWLDERGRHAQAKYLREVALSKFLRRLVRYGGYGLYPEPTNNPPRIRGKCAYSNTPAIQRYWGDPPPEPSARLTHWKLRIRRGWRPSSRVSRSGYYSMTEHLGVYIWEYLNVLYPLSSTIREVRRGE